MMLGKPEQDFSNSPADDVIQSPFKVNFYYLIEDTVRISFVPFNCCDLRIHQKMLSVYSVIPLRIGKNEEQSVRCGNN